MVPAAIHGAYDYIASIRNASWQWVFLAFIAVLFIVSFILVDRMSKNDKYFEVVRRRYRY